ncbi:MAG: thiamine pyrophosphate-binding protein [Nitrospinota bacterium]
MTNADLLVAMLREAGVRYAFGIPSGQVLRLIEAMRTGGIEYVLVAHEATAGFMAGVVGRLTGTPGVCLSTLGPGATNLATGVGDAFLDRSPVVAITGNVPLPQVGRRIQMHIDHHALFRPITKATYLLMPGRVAKTIRDALTIALTEPPGPVHLDLCEDVAEEVARERPLPLKPAGVLREVPLEDILRVRELLSQAHRPVAVIGNSAYRARAREPLLRFVEAQQLPFATTTMAKGLLPDDHPLAIGCIERARRQLQRQFLRQADLVLGLGYDPVEVEYEAWIGRTPLVHVDIEPADADESVRLVHQVVGDLLFSFSRLAGLEPIAHEWPADAVLKHMESFQKALRPPGDGFAPHRALDILREEFPREGILAFDVGAHTHQIASQWTAYEPDTFLITNGWSSMGFGVPAALAAKLVRRERPVVCVVGDGCFQMTAGEMATARRLGLPIPFIVLNDRWLSLIRVKQAKRHLGIYGTELLRESNPPPAHHFGVPCVGARDAEGFRKALREALAAPGPTVIEADVDARQYMETVYD